jgi:hypothetical protein
LNNVIVYIFLEIDPYWRQILKDLFIISFFIFFARLVINICIILIWILLITLNRFFFIKLIL